MSVILYLCIHHSFLDELGLEEEGDRGEGGVLAGLLLSVLRNV